MVHHPVRIIYNKNLLLPLHGTQGDPGLEVTDLINIDFLCGPLGPGLRNIEPDIRVYPLTDLPAVKTFTAGVAEDAAALTCHTACAARAAAIGP